MKLKKSTLWISLCALVFSLIYHIWQNSLSWVHLSDTLFIICLFFLIVGGFLWVFSSGSFDFFQKSLHLKRKTDYESEWKLSTIGKEHKAFFLQPGIILLAISILLLLVDMLV
ncbi:DUF3899 domain-containing protein [Holzapfeliella sp. He02]|uniref:DUF3899 domain-containing protein n=1 Tax=Holzapfeliella saturejae TaxID=3082953 RepID=A0ABU8SE57_9LACO